MEWFETETRNQLAEAATRFASRELAPLRRASAEHARPGVPWEALGRASEMGLLSGVLPEGLGGIGLDPLSEAILWERMAAGLAGPAALMALHAAALRVLAELRDIPGVKNRLESLGETEGGRTTLLGIVLPEPVVEAGTEPLPRFEAAKGGAPAFSVHGRFLCLPGFPAAAGLAVLVPAGAHGSALLWTEGRGLEPHASAGHPGTGLEELPSHRVALRGPPPAGAEVLCTGERAERLCRLTGARLRLSLAAVQTGNADAARRDALAYAMQRVQTGRILFEHQEVRRMLAEMACLMEACRSTVYRAAAMLGAGQEGALEPAAKLAGQAHRFCDTAAERVCLDAVQILGGYGYMKDYGMEKRLRDCKSLQAVLGSYVEDWLGEAS